MSGNTGRTLTIEEVSARFQQWRQNRKGKAAIPDELWSAAMELARNHGVNPTASELRLDGSKLKLFKTFNGIFFEHTCDRPGCYEGFAHHRRSPLQRFVAWRAGERWSGWWSGSGAGRRRAFNPDKLIASEDSPYIQPVDATGPR